MELIDRQKAIEALQKGRPIWKDGDDYQYGRASQWTSDIMTIERVEAENRWIPCSELMPKQGQEVICQCRASIIKVLKLNAHGDWYQDAKHCYMRGFVIAWMPLPEPYEERREADGKAN